MNYRVVGALVFFFVAICSGCSSTETNGGPDQLVETTFSTREIVAIERTAAGLAKRGRLAEAIEQYESALSFRRDRGEKRTRALFRLYSALGVLHAERKQFSDALTYFKLAMDLKLAEHQGDHPEVAELHNNLGTTYQRMGKLQQAERSYREAILMTERIYGRYGAPVGIPLNNLGLFYYSTKQYAKAQTTLKKALQIFEVAHGRTSKQVESVCLNLAALHRKLGQKSKVRDYESRVKRIRTARRLEKMKGK